MKTHPTDLLSLVPGLIFVAIGVVALGDWIDLDAFDGRWIGPSVLILLGIAVLASAGIGTARRPAVDRDEAADVTAGDPDPDGRDPYEG